MYCPTCGVESTIGLNYCKHCGGILADTAAAPPTKNIVAALILAAATVSIVLGGLAIVFNLTLSLIGPQRPGISAPVPDAVAVAGMMVLSGSAAIIFSTFMLIKLFTRVMGFGSSPNQPRIAKTLQPSPRISQIPSPPVAAPSVTEHTTRNFEPRSYQRGVSE